MTYAAGQAEPNDSPIPCAAVALAPEIKAAADVIERERQLPKSIVDGLRHAGVVRMAMPRTWDGLEPDPLTQFRVLESRASGYDTANCMRLSWKAVNHG